MPHFAGRAKVRQLSIHTARNFIEKSGCGYVVGIVVIVVMVAGLFYVGMFQSEQEQQAIKPIEIAKVGAQPVSLQSIEDRYRIAAATQAGSEGGVSPEMDTLLYGMSLDTSLRQAATRELAARKGIGATDDEVVRMAEKQVDEMVAERRALLQTLGQIKPTASEAEIQSILAGSLGAPPDKLRAAEADNARRALADPSKRPEVLGMVIANKLLETYAKEARLTEAELKKEQEKLVTKRIRFSLPTQFDLPDYEARKIKEKEVLEKALKVEQDIRSGRISFEAAMDRYSDDPAPKGKKKSETTIDLSRSVLAYDVGYKELNELRIGDISPVIRRDQEMLLAIFKLVKWDATLDKSFESQKDQLMKTRLQQMAQRRVYDEVEKLVALDKIKWASPGFEVLAKWFEAQNDFDLAKNPAKLKAAMTKLAEDAKKAVDAEDPAGSGPATAVRFAALDTVFDESSAAERAKVSDDWIEAARDILVSTESADLRIEIAEVMLDKKNMDGAREELLAAAQANGGQTDAAIERFKKIEALRAKLTGDTKELAEEQKRWKEDAIVALKDDAELNTDYTETGREAYAAINKKLARYRALGIITSAQAKEIQAFQQKWRTEKAKFDEEEAQRRKEEEAEAKKAAEEAKKKASQEQPNKGNTSGALPGSAPGSVLPPTTGGKTGG